MTSRTPWAQPTPQMLDLARELIAAVADEGDIELAAECYAELAGADPGAEPIDLSNVDAMLGQQFSHAATVAAEDAAPKPRSAEARLANALGRISRGTYQPAGTIEFSSPSSAARELARARWGAQQPGPVTGRPNCGASDDLGYCINASHDLDCGSIASTEIGDAMRDSGAYARTAAQPGRRLRCLVPRCW